VPWSLLAELNIFNDSNYSHENNDLCSLKELWNDIQNTEHVDWPNVFKTLYLHACLKGKSSIAAWFQTDLYSLLDPIQQIALRQTFPYGTHLLKKAAEKNKK
jgi:hypothetical protein